MNYDKYKLGFVEWLALLAKSVLLTSVISILFYDSWYAMALVIPIGIVGYRRAIAKGIETQKEEITKEFVDLLRTVNTALRAGYSIENAFGEAIGDLSLMYDEDADIIQEFSWIRAQIALNKTVEEVLGDLAYRTGIEDVENFAEIFQTAKKRPCWAQTKIKMK